MTYKPPHILISGGLAAGGVQTHVTLLCKVLRAAGAEVTIAAVSTNWPSEVFEELRSLGVNVILPVLGKKISSRRLARVEAATTWPMRLSRDFDVLYCHGHGRMHLWMRRFLRKGGASIYHEIVEPPASGSLMAQVAGAMGIVVASSDSVAHAIKETTASRFVQVIPCFSTENAIPPPEPCQPIADRTLRAAYFGRLVTHKQPDWLVREWSRISKQFPLAPARLDVYGADYPDQPMLESLRAFVREQGLEAQITLHGAYDHNDPRLLAQTDLVLLPSRVEGVPLVLLEAVQHGVPFVAMAAGGIDSLAVDNPDVLVTPIDNDAFIAAVQVMAEKLRKGKVDNRRLHLWAKHRYGHERLSTQWRELMFDPKGVLRRTHGTT